MAIQTLDIINSCLTTTISCSNVASCTLIVEQQIIGPAFAGLPDLQLRLWWYICSSPGRWKFSSWYQYEENTLVYQYAKQNIWGVKKCGANQKQHCKQAGATKRFDISWGQEVSYFSNSLNDTQYYSIFSQVWLALSLGHLL